MIHVVVTGASRGIGLGLARAFVQAGCRVTVTSRDGTTLERALVELRTAASPDTVVGMPCDVSKPDQVRELAHFAERTAPVDIWVNNAGRNLPPAPFWQQDAAALSDLVSSNLSGVVLCSHAALRTMVARGGGKVYNMEGFGADGAILAGFAPYGATKRAVRYFSQALARETKPSGVIIATVDPGVVETDMLSEHLSDDAAVAPKGLARAVAAGLGRSATARQKDAPQSEDWRASSCRRFAVGFRATAHRTFPSRLTTFKGPGNVPAMTRDEILARAERDRLFDLFEESPALLTVVEGPELRITMINRLVREQPAGRAALGKSARDIYPGDNPIVATLERVYSTGIGETIHGVPPYFRDGAHADRYFTRRFAPLRDAQGNVNGVLVLGYEVTAEVRARQAHEESERRSQADLQRLFALLEEAPMLIGVLEGPELRVVMMNRLSRELFGGRDLRGVAFVDVVSESNTALAAARRVFRTGIPETFDVASSHLDGFVGRSFSNAIVPIRDLNGQITCVMTASLEVTEQLRARAALESQARDLESARRQAVEASRAKDEFLAMLGHELRNPLAPMATTLDAMRLRGVASREIDILERQVRHLTRLVDDLLDVSRITRGLVELKRRDLDFRTVVTRALEMTNPLIEQREQRVIVDMSPVAVHADPDRLAQVVANLITNAAKYSEIGAQIRIFTQRSGPIARLTVADDGIGITPDVIGGVFDAFAQAPQMLARSHGGLGLGLSIVKSLVEAHDGTVSAHSDGPGKGSTFVVELPAIDSASSGAEVSNSDVRNGPSIAPLRILVVDDNHDAAAALQGALEELGHFVAVAHDGPAALAEAAIFEPQVGLLDIGLPVMDGYELAVAMRATRPIHLVAISGYGQERDRQRSDDAGFESHLVKPVYLDDLVPLLDRISASERARES